jgi:hypothetical protein
VRAHRGGHVRRSPRLLAGLDVLQHAAHRHAQVRGGVSRERGPGDLRVQRRRSVLKGVRGVRRRAVHLKHVQGPDVLLVRSAAGLVLPLTRRPRCRGATDHELNVLV